MAGSSTYLWRMAINFTSHLIFSSREINWIFINVQSLLLMLIPLEWKTTLDFEEKIFGKGDSEVAANVKFIVKTYSFMSF